MLAALCQTLITHTGKLHLLTSMQDDGWVTVDRKNRRRHAIAQQFNQVLPDIVKAPGPEAPQAPLPPLCNQTSAAATSTKAVKATPTPSMTLVSSITLPSLPAMALACILQHLDFTSQCNLRKTCRSLAAEFALPRAGFVEQCRQELHPSITRDPPETLDLYGTEVNPVVLHVTWADPGSTLRLMYSMGPQPGFMSKLWRHAWPEELWSDLVADGLSSIWPMQPTIDHSGDGRLCILVDVELASNEPLRLPWDWLAQCLLQPPAIGLTEYLQATTLQLTDQFCKCVFLQLCLYRPAQAGQLQLIMCKDFPTRPYPYFDEDGACIVILDPDHDGDGPPFYTRPPPFYTRPRYMQKVVITGHWCQELPEPEPLWHAQCGHLSSVRGMISGDYIAVDVQSLADDLGVPDISMHCSLRVEVQNLKPFTYGHPVPDHPDWKLKRQHAKKRGNVKKLKTAKRHSRAVSSRSDEAKWLYDSIHDMSLNKISCVK